MLKKLLAGVAALALALGGVALTSMSASAHNGALDGTVACQTDGTYTVTWTFTMTNTPTNDHATVKVSGFTPANTTVSGGGGKWVGTDFVLSTPDGANGTPIHLGNYTVTFTQAGIPGTATAASATAYVDWYEWSGHATSYPKTKTLAGTCNVTIPPTAPTFTPSVCNGPGTSTTPSYFVPVTDHVKYYVKVGDASSYPAQPTATGTYNPTTGQKIWVKAVPDQGYTFAGGATKQEWSQTFDSAGDCTSHVTPGAPSYTESVCTGALTESGGSFKVTGTTGVNYEYSFSSATGPWTPLSNGTSGPATAGSTVYLHAIAQPHYALDGTTTWNHTFTIAGSPTPCFQKVPPVAPDFTEAVCTTPGQSTLPSYTIHATTGVLFTVTVNGQPASNAPGIHYVSYGDTVVVSADGDIANGYILTDGPQTWGPTTFAAEKDCLVEATPVTPAFTSGICTAPGQSSDSTFQVFAAAHVSYQYSLDNATWLPAAAGSAITVPAGSHVFVRANPDSGYQILGQRSWDQQLVNPGPCLVEAFPGDPLFVDGACTAPGQSTLGSFEIIAADHVSYEYSFDNSTWLPAAVGVHDAPAGSHVYLRANPEAGYTILVPNTWDHQFTTPGDCLVETTPLEPGVTAQSCDATNGGTLVDGYITIPAGNLPSHVSYFISGAPAAPGNHVLKPGSYVVTATAEVGYTLVGYPVEGWSKTITPSDACGQLEDHPIVTPAVVFVQSSCTAPGSFTLSNDLGISDAVIWTVNGAPASEGKHTVAGDGIVYVHAAPNAPDFGFADGTTADWSFEFSTPTVCELTTLAVTGQSPWGFVGIAGVLLVAGATFLVARRRENATD